MLFSLFRAICDSFYLVLSVFVTNIKLNLSIEYLVNKIICFRLQCLTLMYFSVDCSDNVLCFSWQHQIPELLQMDSGIYLRSELGVYQGTQY